MTLVLATGTSLPLLLPFRCALSIASCCIPSCCIYPMVFFGQDLRDDALTGLGTSYCVGEDHLKCVPRSQQLDPNRAGKKCCDSLLYKGSKDDVGLGFKVTG